MVWNISCVMLKMLMVYFNNGYILIVKTALLEAEWRQTIKCVGHALSDQRAKFWFSAFLILLSFHWNRKSNISAASSYVTDEKEKFKCPVSMN